MKNLENVSKFDKWGFTYSKIIVFLDKKAKSLYLPV
jgi:phage pi2 protein 07